MRPALDGHRRDSPTPPTPCVVPGEMVHDVSVAADGARLLFSSTRMDRDVAIATLSPVPRG